MKTIDLNADVGEGMATDRELFPIISSANTSCGLHAGSAMTMMQAVGLSRGRYTVGAHPSFDDRENFGRVEHKLKRMQLYAILLQQLGAISMIGEFYDIPVRYIKLHGALYNMACRLRAKAKPVVEFAEWIGLPLLALPNSELEKECLAMGVPFFREGFADRRYDGTGKLVPRNQPNAFIEDPSEAVEQVHRLIEDHGVQSICIHGDNPDAVRFARTIRAKLEAAGYQIKPFA